MLKNKVVIIDSGVSNSYVEMNSINVCKSLCVCNAQNNEIVDDMLGHGTSIVNIIFSLHKECEFIILKIYEQNLQQEVNILIRALQKVLDLNIRESIIHMSVGVDFYCRELYEICKTISEKGNILVAAYDNAGCVSYPAAFDCVIGVEGNMLCSKATDFIVNENNMVDVYAKGGNHRVLEKDGTFTIRQGNSYSAAFVTGILSRNKFQEYTKKGALAELCKISTFHGKINKNENNYFDLRFELKESEKSRIKKIAIFPYNKETKVLLRYSKYLNYELIDIYSTKYLKNIGREVQNKEGDVKYIIKSIDEACWENIDTLIIGHVTQLEFYIPGIKSNVLMKCLHKGINVYSLDTDLLSDYIMDFNKKGLLLRCPTIRKNRIKKNGKLFQISTPIIGIFGTSSNQGKFSLQVELKKQLEYRQYSVGFLATEPIGELFGAERTIPYGYEGVRNVSDYEFIDMFNTQLHEIELLNREIIITGAQSRAIPQSSLNLGVMAIKQIEYMLAIQPDVVLLCINYNDNVDYIIRTINIIENLVETHVLGLVLFPLGYKNAWAMQKEKMEEISKEKLDDIKKCIQKEIKRKVYIVGYDEVKICDDIIDFF